MTVNECSTGEQRVDDPIDVVAAVCFFAVTRALQFAAQRSHATGRSNGKQFGVARHLVHTRVGLGDDWGLLLRGAWETLPVVIHGPTERYAAVCEQYTRRLIVERRVPDRVALRTLLGE